MTGFVIILTIVFLTALIHLFDIDIENLPQCWIIRYTNPITKIRYEKIYGKKTI